MDVCAVPNVGETSLVTVRVGAHVHQMTYAQPSSCEGWGALVYRVSVLAPAVGQSLKGHVLALLLFMRLAGALMG